MSAYGLQFEMEHKIVRKFEKAGATSFETAVSEEDAHLNTHEQFWLGYFAGIFLGKIKKTQNHRYYV
ncbi:MAG: hypothetical protein ACOWW1_00175 [archaeon]